MQISIPELSLVTLIGISGSGKSSFALRHFKPTEVLSSDTCRALVSDDENNQAATNDAFDTLYYIAGKRLKNGLLTVIDATNVQQDARRHVISLAREYHCLPVAIVLDLPAEVCRERNANRPDRDFGNHVLRNQQLQLKRSIRKLKDEGFRHVFVLKFEEEVDSVKIVRERLYNDKHDESGPFDIIGDIHGCFDELLDLLELLGYNVQKVSEDETDSGFHVTAPEGRKAIFLGDLVDRGPDSSSVLRLVMSMVNNGTAYCVPGNHDIKLQKYLKGKSVQMLHGMDLTISQLKQEPEAFRNKVREFLYGLVSHYVLDNGRLVVSHAGLREDMQGRTSGAVRSFCLYGETTGETDEFGLPVRYNWANEYRGKARVVYGHTPVPEPEWLNRTIDIDTGCVYGGKLTALRYPEEELVSVKSRQVYFEPARPIDFEQNHQQNAQHENDDLLDISDVTGKRIIQTRLRNNITILEENSIAALEVMSRFAVNPKWLIYLPPTMSPCATSPLPDYLEHPAEALGYYRSKGIEKVVCEQKHMGSRVVLVICRDTETVFNRFGITGGSIGVCYTRTGRSFFTDRKMEAELLQRVNNALSISGFWEKFNTDWVCLDAELMPWSAKAQSLLKNQYASVGSAAGNVLPEVIRSLQSTVTRGITDAGACLEKYMAKEQSVNKYITAYRTYCWPVTSINDYKLAPFHILATENHVHADKNHEWHMQEIAGFCTADPQLLLPTPYQVIDLNDPASFDEAVAWWTGLTRNGGEGMVVKPYDFISLGKEGLLQPAVKCRGREYLRIIYGPEYDLPVNLKRLKNRSLGRKQSLALREFALGIEALERFVRKEPLRRIHESVFGVLALESEEVDPRL